MGSNSFVGKCNEICNCSGSVTFLKGNAIAIFNGKVFREIVVSLHALSSTAEKLVDFLLAALFKQG